MKNPLNLFNKTERFLLISSVIVITVSYLLSGSEGWLSWLVSIIGAISVIFVAKGYVFGQFLSIFFSFLYGVISLKYHYYGEMLTYWCMAMPVAIVAVVSWIKHPYKDSKEVEVGDLNPKKISLLSLLTVVVTIAFYFILKALGTASLIVSTISVITSFAAAALSALRSPYYALAYTANDVVLIVLWILASVKDINSLPMVFCFVMFMADDIYGFCNWTRMRKQQRKQV